MWWMAIIGAAANQVSYLSNIRKNRNEITRQQDMAKKAYGYQKDYNDSMFRLQKGEALDTLGIQKNRLAQAFDMDLSGFNLGLEGQALGNHAARVGLSESEGAALAAQGAGGTRGSDSLQMQIDYQESMFGRQMDLQDRGNSLAVNNMAMQYGNARGDIDREIDSWGPDGYKTRAKGLSDAYAANMHGLRMGEYENAYDNAGFNFMDFLVSGLSGAGQGAQYGQQIDSLMDQYGKSTPQTAGAAPSYGSSYGFGNYMPDYGGNAMGVNSNLFWQQYGRK